MSSRTRLAGPRTLRKLRMKSVAFISGTPSLCAALTVSRYASSGTRKLRRNWP